MDSFLVQGLYLYVYMMEPSEYHIYLRAGFGPAWSQLFSPQGPSRALKQLLNASSSFEEIETEESPERVRGKFFQMDQAAKLQAVKANREAIGKLNLRWFQAMCRSEDQLREKMALFWHDHFACQLKLAKAAQIQVHTLRTHALGNFGELLHAISKDPGMLLFLNNQQNKKSHPNENFARELLELFTVGRGNYTEEDVKEAARAFTGWSTLPNGSFFFRRRQHDYGKKSFLGRRGNFSGEDIINILLEEKATAQHITRKLYRFLVNPKENPEQISQWASIFYQSGYEIKTLHTTIFESDHFYDPAHIGVRIKSPVEYLVGIFRLLQCEQFDSQGILILQKILGQTLFFPPNVAGWPEDKAWIDGSTLLTRLQFPFLLLNTGDLPALPKDPFAGNEEFLSRTAISRRLDLEVAWEPLYESLQKLSQTEIEGFTQRATLPFSTQTPQKLPSITSLDTFALSMIQQLATPAFQLC